MSQSTSQNQSPNAQQETQAKGSYISAALSIVAKISCCQNSSTTTIINQSNCNNNTPGNDTQDSDNEGRTSLDATVTTE